MRSSTVLVVDDDPDLRSILQSVLVSEGYQVSTAADGGLIDVIIMDVTMPHLSGLQVCHLLRRRGDHTPGQLLSGLATNGDRAAGLTAGADDYLTKPFHLDEVLAHVQALLPSDPAEERPNVGGG